MPSFPLTLLTTLAITSTTLAAPLTTIKGRNNDRTHHPTRSPDFFAGRVDFFSRYDCTNPCVNQGCVGHTASKGDLHPDTHYGDWTSFAGSTTCWDVPAGAHSLALTVSTGHGYTGSSFACEQVERAYKVTHDYTGAKAFPLESGKGEHDGQVCNGAEALPEEMRSVSYNW